MKNLTAIAYYADHIVPLPIGRSVPACLKLRIGTSIRGAIHVDHESDSRGTQAQTTETGPMRPDWTSPVRGSKNEAADHGVDRGCGVQRIGSCG